MREKSKSYQTIEALNKKKSQSNILPSINCKVATEPT